MAFAEIYFENPRTGQKRIAPVGFSWTVFFFSFFPPLFRGDWKWGLIILLLAICTCHIATLVFMFIYNKLYIKDLISNGYLAKGADIGTLEQLSFKLGFEIPRLPSEVTA